MRDVFPFETNSVSAQFALKMETLRNWRQIQLQNQISQMFLAFPDKI